MLPNAKDPLDSRVDLLTCYAVPGANARANRGSSMVGGMGRRPAGHAMQPHEAAGAGVHTAGERPSGASSAQTGSRSRHPIVLSGHGSPGEVAWPVAPAPSRGQCSPSQGVRPGGRTSNLAAADTASMATAPWPPAPASADTAAACAPASAACAPAYAACAPASAASAA